MNGARTKTVSKGPQRRSKGDTTVRVAQVVVPKLPHERDESPASGKKPPAPVIAQAADDLKRGKQDTDRAPQTNRLARKLNSTN